MVGIHSSFQIWQKLHVYFASHNHVKVKKLKVHLHTPKNNQIISAYHFHIKKIVDCVAVEKDSKISYWCHFNSLSEEYDSFITFVSFWIDHNSIEDIKGPFLLNKFEKN